MIKQTKTLKRIMSLTLLAIGAVVLSLAPETYGRMILTIDDSTTPGVDVILIDDVDGVVGDATMAGNANTFDAAIGDGAILYNSFIQGFAALPNWSLVGNLSTSKPINPSPVLLDINFAATSIGAGTLTMFLTDTDFVTPSTTAGLMVGIGGTINAPAGSLVIGGGGLNDANQEFGGPFTTTGPLFAGAFNVFGGGTNLSNTVTSPYSVLAGVVIHHTGAGQTTGDLSVNAVPEPSTYALMGMGLIGLIGYRRKMAKKNA